MANKTIKPIISDDELLIKYIETLTHSGLPTLDTDLVGKIKGICRKTPCHVEKAYSIILGQLKKKHAEVRLSAFQLCVLLFKKAHKFRLLVVNNLENILELTAGIETTKPLPPPKEIAKKMKELALLTVLQWKTEFGQTYKQFLICYNYLEKCKNVDFEGMERAIAAADTERAERERKALQARKQVFDNFMSEFIAKATDIENTIEAINNCVSLLLPPLEDFFVASDSAAEEPPSFAQPIAHQTNDSEQDSFNPRLFGLRPSYNLVISIDHKRKVRVDRTEENCAIIDNLKENVKLGKKRFRALVSKWQDVCDNYSQDRDYNKKVKSLKERLEGCLEKCKELSIESLDDTSDDDDDMEEVVKEGYEPAVLPIFQEPGPSKAPLNTSQSFSQKRAPTLGLTCKDRKKIATTTVAPTDKREEAASSSSKVSQPSAPCSKETSRKERLLALAPKLPYDVDLYHWEDEHLTPPTLVSITMGNPEMWGSRGDDMDELPAPGGVAALRTRVIEYTGEFQPVTRSCRAPLPSGKLCPRLDRLRCPFHGKIVPRDESGQCSLPMDLPSSSSGPAAMDPVEEEEPVPDWQDPVLLAQLKAATGIDLKMPVKKKKGQKNVKKKGPKKPRRRKGEPSADVLSDIKERKFPGLTDLERRKSNQKTRLKKKIFNKSALRRVADAVNKLERRRHGDKFGDQFNYML